MRDPAQRADDTIKVAAIAAGNVAFVAFLGRRGTATALPMSKWTAKRAA